MKLPRDRISPRQLGALALTAAELPIFRLCSRISWLWVLPGGAGAVGLLLLLTAWNSRRRASGRGAGRFRLPLCPLLFAVALYAAWESSFAFPETAENWLAAFLILVLAAAAAWIGPAAAGRCAGILLCITGLLYGIVLLFSLPQLRLERLTPAGGPAEGLAAFGGLLLPGAALCLEPELGEEQRLPGWTWPAVWAGALAASLVTGGILSPALARDPEAFRTLARGVSVLGVIRRFEALVNGAMLMSGFCLCTLYLTALRSLLSRETALKKIFEKTQKKC